MTFEEFRHFQETESTIRRGESPSGSCPSLLAPLTLEGLRDNNAINSAFSVEREKTEKNSSFLTGRFFSKLFTEQSEVNNRLSRSSSKNFESGGNSPENGTIIDMTEKTKENENENENGNGNGNGDGNGNGNGKEKEKEKEEEKVNLKLLKSMEGNKGEIKTTHVQPVGPKIDNKNATAMERTSANTTLKRDDVVVDSKHHGVKVGNKKRGKMGGEGGKDDDESEDDHDSNIDNDDNDSDNNDNNDNNDDDDFEMEDVVGSYLKLQDDSYDDDSIDVIIENTNTRKI